VKSIWRRCHDIAEGTASRAFLYSLCGQALIPSEQPAEVERLVALQSERSFNRSTDSGRPPNADCRPSPLPHLGLRLSTELCLCASPLTGVRPHEFKQALLCVLSRWYRGCNPPAGPQVCNELAATMRLTWRPRTYVCAGLAPCLDF